MKSGSLRKLGLVPAVAAALMLGGCDKAEDEHAQKDGQHQSTTQPSVTHGSGGYYHGGMFYPYGSGPHSYLNAQSAGQPNGGVRGSSVSSSSARGGFGSSASGHASGGE